MMKALGESSRVRIACLGLAAALTAALVGPGADARLGVSPTNGRVEAPSAGDRGVGDQYFPTYGNGGYQVRHYNIHVTYTPRTDRLDGVTVIRARTTKALSSFHLDLLLRPLAVWVNGNWARFRKPNRHELVVVPAVPVAAKQRLCIRVVYTGVPSNITVPSHEIGQPPLHPWRSPGLEAFVNGFPEGAALWFPVNDHPVDKASYRITAHVPPRWEAVSNGHLVTHRRTATGSVWRWREPSRMVSYLAYLGIGQYAIRQGVGRDGRPFTYVWSRHFDSSKRAKVRHALHVTPRLVSWLSKRLGRYPFRHVGGVVPRSNATNFNVATIESQTGPVYNSTTLTYDHNAVGLMAHELAHQWFGDSVSLHRYRDLWLNEGFAVWCSWLYAARHGGHSLNEQMLQQYSLFPASSDFWRQKTGNPGPHNLYRPVYARGAMTAQALRNVVGPHVYMRIVRTWLRTNKHGHGTTRQFIRLSERVSGRDLGHLFNVWLYVAQRPAQTTTNGFPPR